MAALNKSKGWCLYALKCRGSYIYTGVTNDLEKRMETHAKGRGSKYVRSHLPFELMKTIPCKNKTEALKLEYKLKRMKRDQKLAFLGIQCGPSTILPRIKIMDGSTLSNIMNTCLDQLLAKQK